MTEGMNAFLQVLGSVASVAAIPLSVYLYLRSREAKVTQVRREIGKILSYQFGEGRQLSPFELQAVIVSKTRESGIRPGSITSDQMIEDLVAETITTPMLESSRKAQIISDLQWMYRQGAIVALMTRYPIALSDVLTLVSQHHRVDPKDAAMVDRFGVSAKEPPSPQAEVGWTGTLSSVFALVAFGLSLVTYYLTEATSLRTVVENIRLPAFQFILGLLSSIVATLLAFAVMKLAQARRHQSGHEQVDR